MPFLFPASYINSKITTGGEASNMKPAFAFFEDFQPFPSESVEPIIAELSFLSLLRRSREFSVRSHQRRRRLLKKPQLRRIDRRSTPSNRRPNMNEKASVSKELEAKHTKVFQSLSIYISSVLFETDRKFSEIIFIVSSPSSCSRRKNWL